MNEFSAVHLQRGSHAGAAHMTRGSHVTGAKVIMLGTPVHGLPAQLTPRYHSEGQRTACPLIWRYKWYLVCENPFSTKTRAGTFFLRSPYTHPDESARNFCICKAKYLLAEKMTPTSSHKRRTPTSDQNSPGIQDNNRNCVN